LKKGLFITFEGIEGSGKTTQINLLINYLITQKFSVIKTKEPGGTEFGLEIRRILLDKNIEFKSNFTESLLFTADRLEHLEQVVKPAISEGTIVISDRYKDSTYAYQLGGRNVPLSLIEFLDSLYPINPDLTILLDIEPELGITRIKNRNSTGYENYKNNRFEQEKIDFYLKIRAKYLDLQKKEPERIKLIKVDDQKPEEVFQKIKKIIDDKISN